MRDTKGRFIDGTHGVSTRFTREKMIGNQNAKGNPPNRTTFGVIDISMEKHPSWKGGLQKMERDGYHINLGNNKRIQRSKYVWQQVYGEVPKGYVMYHKDGDKFNDELENLECIPRSELIKRNTHKIL
mgnify:CR=1 FL=1